MGEIEDRKFYSTGKLSEIIPLMFRAENIAGTAATIFVSGSYGRLEASVHSDLDAHIVANSKTGNKSALRLLDEILIKAELISAIKATELPEIDGDGRYLGQFIGSDLVREIGSPEDDSQHTFTTRMLMLLEGRPIVGSGVFASIRSDIIASYWAEYSSHKEDFIPAFFANDILRMWRTFCVNYEARTRSLPRDQQTKREIKNYKLKHSRMITCYSAIIYLLAIYRAKGAVDPESALFMCSLTPLERLEAVRDMAEYKYLYQHINVLIEMYERFLEFTNSTGFELEKKINNRQGYRRDD